jgi:hypothetical protein
MIHMQNHAEITVSRSVLSPEEETLESEEGAWYSPGANVEILRFLLLLRRVCVFVMFPSSSLARELYRRARRRRPEEETLESEEGAWYSPGANVEIK